ncbi:DUF599 family protein [Shewanella sp. YLB-09]|nr:DUF599 family protein [Shewanella sp. YLB-09]
MLTSPVLDLIAFICFVVCWIGYTYFAKRKAKNTNCIARCLHQHRIHWMNELMRHEMRVGEAALLANLERNITFFASTSMLILAGVLTLFAQVGRLEAVIASIPFTATPTDALIQIKLSLLTFIFVMAFFQFTWSMRQYGFLNVMLGATPLREYESSDHMKNYATQMAIVQDQAAHAYNYGLRGYYFSMAVLSWFFHPLLFIISSLLVVYTLYMREFKSKAVMAITEGMIMLQREEQERKELKKESLKL